MAAGGLSAVKLEKAIMNLETRLREEFRKDLKRQVAKQMQPYVRDIEALQLQLRGLSSNMAESRSLVAQSRGQPDGSADHEPPEMVHVDLDALMGDAPHQKGHHLPTKSDLQVFHSETSVAGQPRQPIFSMEMGETPAGNSASVGTEAGAVRDVAREVAQVNRGDEGSPTEGPGDFDHQDSKQSMLDPDTVEEPVAFLETAWNLVLVLGHTNSGPLDLCIACFLWLASGLMQISFFVILLSEDFLGAPFSQQVEEARKWRETVAHDYKHMDLGEESLVQRVCRLDGTLIVATLQTQLLDQINAFIGLGREDLEAPYFQPGVLLCMMCILLWCLYLVNEFRLVVFSLEAVSQIPRSFQTQWRGRGGFRTISYGRFSVYCMMRLARFFIAVGLLYAGVQWLAGTTSITELILNAVALSAVLQIDEMIFSALMPKKIQICIQDLEAIKVRYSKGRSQVESTVLLFAICLLMLWPWTNNVGPLSRDMLEVKRQFCGGSQNFVVTDNQLQLVTVGMVTGEYNSSAEETASLLRYSVAQHIWHEDVGTSNIIKFSKDRTTFREDMGMTMYQRNLHDSLCLDFDEIFLTNASHELQEFYRPYFFSASFEAGYPEGATCEAMSNLCHSIEPQGRLVRHVCPRTCGCQDQFTNPVLQVLGEGCSKKCHNERTETMRFSACQDVDLNSSVTLRQGDHQLRLGKGSRPVRGHARAGGVLLRIDLQSLPPVGMKLIK